MPERPLIALGIPTERAIHNYIFLRWLELLRSYDWPGPIFYVRGAPGFAAARNTIMGLAWASEEPWDALLFWDSDQLPPLAMPWPNHSNLRLPGWDTYAPLGPEHFLHYLDRLLIENPDKEVVAGLYWSRDLGHDGKPPFEPLAYRAQPHEDGSPGFRHLSASEVVPMIEARGLYRVDGAGTGSMLIRRSVFERLREAKAGRPLFEQPMLTTGRQAGLNWTEDLLFCHEISTLLDPPVEIWLDTCMESGHQTDVWVSTEHYLATRGMLRQPEQPKRILVPRRG